MSHQIPYSTPSGIDQMDLLTWTFGNTVYDQNRHIYIDPDNPEQAVTAAEARTTVRKLVAGFQAVGLCAGDTVCVHSFNHILYSMILLGIIGAGGRFTGSNPAYTPSELSQHIRITKVRFLVTDPTLLPKIALVVEECGLSASNVFVLNESDRDLPLYHHSWKELLAYGERDWTTFNEPKQAKTTIAALLSTSGTTGLPKAAMISHHSLVMQNIILNDARQKPYDISRLISLPIFHAFAFPLAHISPLRDGIPTYIMRRFNLHQYLSAISQYQITETAMVPPIVLSILKISSVAQHLMPSLRCVWCAGARLAQTTQERLYRLLQSNARVLQVWGMTEAGWITTFLYPEEDHSGSVGRLLPGMEAKLIYDDGSTIKKDDMQAEICVRGPFLMQGYLDNAEANEIAFDEQGWLRTGDVAYYEEGKYYIVDRKKEMIKVRGWQVSPAELEAALLLHPDISDAAVIGVMLPEGETELPRAYIVKSLDKPTLSESDILEYMVKCLARYKSLDGGVIFVDAIPRNAAGKILRGTLREQAAAAVRETQTSIPNTDGPADDPHSIATSDSGRGVESEASVYESSRTVSTTHSEFGEEGDITERSSVKGALMSSLADLEANRDVPSTLAAADGRRSQTGENEEQDTKTTVANDTTGPKLLDEKEALSSTTSSCDLSIANLTPTGTRSTVVASPAQTAPANVLQESSSFEAGTAHESSAPPSTHPPPPFSDQL